MIPAALHFIESAKAEGKPFFVWLNTTRMHLYTRLPDDWRYAAEKYTCEADLHGNGMMQHDRDIGTVLKANSLNRSVHRSSIIMSQS